MEKRPARLSASSPLIFDILKPWPIGLIDARVRGGFGIMLDDLLADMYGLVLLQLAAKHFVG